MNAIVDSHNSKKQNVKFNLKKELEEVYELGKYKA